MPANGNFREFLQGDTVRIKKYFYVLRPILAMQWIEQNRGIVPMEFTELVDELVHEPRLKLAIEKLLADKRKGFESAYLPRINIISEFIAAELSRFKDKAKKQAKQEISFSLLNPFFTNVLKGNINK